MYHQKQFPVEGHFDIRAGMKFLLEGCFELDFKSQKALLQPECASGLYAETQVVSLGPHKYFRNEDLVREGRAQGTQTIAIVHDGLSCIVNDHFPQIFALDMYGWGLSSRPNFDLDQLEADVKHAADDTKEDKETKKKVSSAEKFFVESLESWRKHNNLPKMILAGLTTKTANDALWANGLVDRIFGFNVYVSPNVSKNSSSWDITRNLAGVESESFAFAEQIVKVEAYRPESSFSDAVKGLHLYGGKVMRPDKTLVWYADKTDEAL